MEGLAASPRRVVFDALKGIGIVEVVSHHCLGYGARKFANPYDLQWWTMRTFNRILHFAIPMFLLISAILLTQSLVKRPDYIRFAVRRATRSLWPYLLWSVAYWVFRLFFLRVGSDIFDTQYTYPIIGTISGPHLLVDIPQLFRELLWGKAYYHLYFLTVLLQLALVLPFAIMALRRVKLSLPGILVLAAGTQVAMYLLQRWVIDVSTPASMIIWYTPSVILGVWIGLDMQRWKEAFDKYKTRFAIGALFGLAFYLPVAISLEAGVQVSSFAFNIAFMIYTVAMSLTLVGFGPVIAQSAVGLFVANFGRVSLPMFLIHPMILVLLGGPRISGFLDWLPLSVVWTIALVVAVSYALARLSMASKLDTVLFGQRLPLRPQAQSPQPAASQASA